MSTVARAIEHIGLSPIARRTGYRPSAIHKWKMNGRLPQTDLSGLTKYSELLEELSGGKYTAEQLREATRAAWRKHVRS